MKITEQARHVPDPSLYPELSGDDSDFQLSTIRPEDAGLAMELLIGNYARPLDAVIRELVVNAIDSHRAAGQTRPVEITMPSAEHPQLVIRDFGLGLSPTDMVGVFTRPAASTKREENSSTGGLGIGAKSPFTVADRFVVDGVKDGVRASLVMARIDGQLKHLVRDVQPVDAGTPDGVTVTVPTAATDSVIDDWWRALSRVHFWWDRGLVQITNVDDSPVPLPDYTERILSRKGLRPSMMTGPTAGVVPLESRSHKSTVLMGQIGYDIPDDVVGLGSPVLFRVPVGFLDIAPTRESILDNAHNQDVLSELYREWLEQVIAPYVETLRDPEASVWKICTTLGQLRGLGLEAHAYVFGNRTASTDNDQLVQGLRYPHEENVWPQWRVSARLHGYDGPAELIKDKQYGHTLIYNAARLARGDDNVPPIVFADEQALTSSQLSKLTRWARDSKLYVLRVDRAQLERSPWHIGFDYDHARVFAHDGEIEWIDPGDIQVASAPKKPTAEVSEDTLIQYLVSTPRFVRYDSVPHLSWDTREQSLGELTEWFRGSSKRLAVIDTKANIDRDLVRAGETILFIASGQRAAKVLQKRIKAQAITMAEFDRNRDDLIIDRLTSAQRRHVADYTLLRETALRPFFDPKNYDTSWIDDLTDTGARTVAREIVQLIEKIDRTVARGEKASVNRALAYGPKLRYRRYDVDWLLDNGELGQYGRVIVALSASRTATLSWHRSRVIELIEVALSSYARPTIVALDPDVAATA